MRLIRHPLVKRDLLELVDHIVESTQGDVAAASRRLDEIDALLAEIAANPGSGMRLAAPLDGWLVRHGGRGHRITIVFKADPQQTDIPQVACRLTSRSPDFARWASVFRPERCLSSRKRPKSGGSSLEPAAFWPGRAAFPRGRRTCPAAFVQLGHGSWSCA